MNNNHRITLNTNKNILLNLQMNKTEVDGQRRVETGKSSLQTEKNEKGYMVLSSDDNTIFSENQSEKRADGYVEMDMTLTKADNGGRMGIIFRYNNENDWQGIGILTVEAGIGSTEQVSGEA